MFQPLADRVLVRRMESEEVTPGGLVIPDAAKEKPLEGEVVAVGADVKVVRKGHRVLFAKYGGTDIKLGTEKLLVMKEDEILGLLVDGDGN